MKLYRLSVFLVALLCTIFLMGVVVFGGQFAGGRGTEEDPYLVSTASQLNNIRNNRDYHYKQIADIDLRKYSEDKGWKPIDYFHTSYDGNGYTISNLTINRPQGDDIGLFARVTQKEAVLRNITLVGVRIIGRYEVGALAGENSGTVNNCNSSGTVRGKKYDTGGLVGHNSGPMKGCFTGGRVISEGNNVGGLVGESNNVITESYSKCTIQGENMVTGGLVGSNNGGQIIDSYATGTVTGKGEKVGGLVGESYGPITNSYSEGDVNGSDSVGGLVGENFGCTIENSHATGSVTGLDRVGGFVGDNSLQTNVLQSYATGDVSGDNKVGGLIGNNKGVVSASYSTGDVVGEAWQIGGLAGSNTSDGTVKNCYSTGDVSGLTYVGGLTGQNSATIKRSYSVGKVTGKRNKVGGLIGHNFGPIISSYYDRIATGHSDTSNGTPLSTAAMCKRESFEGWDFTDIWTIEDNETYPYLRWQEGKVPSPDSNT